MCDKCIAKKLKNKMTVLGPAPFCACCYDKGFHSELLARHQAADFEGETSSTRALVVKNYCPCKVGMQLKINEDVQEK